MKIREELKEFAEFQGKVLGTKNFKSGWLNVSTSVLLDSIKKEVKVLEIELIDLNPAEARRECAYIANYCMFLAYKLDRTITH